MRKFALAAALSLSSAPRLSHRTSRRTSTRAPISRAIKTFPVKIGTSWNNQISEKRIIDEIAADAHREGLEAGRRQPRRPRAAPRRHREAEEPEHLLLRGGYGGYGYRGWGGMGGMGTATTTDSEYLVGTLVVDIFDAKTKALIFRGTASDEISDKPEKNVKKVEKAADKMFKDFPPGSKEKK